MALMLLASGMLSVTIVTWAYEVNTHERMSASAVDASVITTQAEVLSNLGLKSLADLEVFPNSKGDAITIVQLIRDGANFEDNLSLYRPINHFFGPLMGKGLSGIVSLVNDPSPNRRLEWHARV